MDSIELRIKVPKPIMDFIAAYLEFCGIDESPEDYLLDVLEFAALAHVKNNLIASLEDSETVLEKYQLKKLLKDVPSEELEL